VQKLFPKNKFSIRKLNTLIITFILIFSFTSIVTMQFNEEVITTPRKNCSIKTIDDFDPITLTPDASYFYGLVGKYEDRAVLDVFVAGDFAYLAVLHGFAVVNISDPLNPTEVAFLYLGATPHRIYVQGNFSYLINGYYLWIIDITDETNPIEMVEYQDLPEANYQDVFTKGNYTYLVDMDYGLKIIKTNVLGSVSKIGQINLGDWRWNIFVYSNTAYIVNWAYAGLELVYIYNPTSPFIQATYSNGTNFYDVHVNGNMVYLTDRYGMVIYDKTILINPVVRGRYSQNRLSNIYVNGSMAYITTFDPYTIVGVDISDPDNPIGIGNFDSENEYQGEVFVSGEFIYSASENVGLEIAGFDADNDKITDYEERQIGTNTTNPDTDGDEMSDYYEQTNGLDPLDPTDADEDLDGDGLTNIEEHGLGTSPNNEDTDSDGLLDGDEVLIYLTNPRRSDTDSDGLDDGDELLIHETDPLDEDTDDDLLSDGDEILLYNTDPLDEDTDGDSLTDGSEVIDYNTNPLAVDTDEDGYTDAEEIAAGTDPLDPDDRPFEATAIYIVAGFLVVLALALGLAFIYRKKTPTKIREEQEKTVTEESEELTIPDISIDVQNEEN